MKLLVALFSFLMHVLASPVTLVLSAGLVVGTWWICRQMRQCEPAEGAELLLTSEWLGA
jgi:hypothetical protein